MDLTADRLAEACATNGTDAGITVHAVLEPLAGPGAPVKPAVYAGGVYQTDRRWWGSGPDRRVVDAIVIDNVPSQANRLEAALEERRGELGLPEIILDLASVGALPPHLPRSLSGFRFPHRHADAYLRDAELNGVAFQKTDVGAALLAATANRAVALLEWFPQALLYGFWQSHYGKKRSQAKLARSWVSEIVGFEPAQQEQRVEAVKGDLLNLSGDEPIEHDPDDESQWTIVEGKARAGKGTKDGLSAIGHGQVVAERSARALGPLSFNAIEQRATVSFASLRRVRVGTSEQDAWARAVLVALGLVAHGGAFSRAFSLRSGAELRPTSKTWTWLGADGDHEVAPLGADAATGLFAETVEAAEANGLAVGDRWATEPLTLTPNQQLQTAIEKTWPAAKEG
jgi:CRISPR-associated protein Csb1